MSLNPPSIEDVELYSLELRTAQWAALVTWYREALGLRSLFRVVDDGYALLSAGGARLAILASSQPGGPTERLALAFEVSDLDTAAARLAAAGTQLELRRCNAEGYDEITTADPDGNQIRLFAWPTR